MGSWQFDHVHKQAFDTILMPLMLSSMSAHGSVHFKLHEKYDSMVCKGVLHSPVLTASPVD